MESVKYLLDALRFYVCGKNRRHYGALKISVISCGRTNISRISRESRLCQSKSESLWCRGPFHQKTNHQTGIDQHQFAFGSFALKRFFRLRLGKRPLKQTGMDRPSVKRWDVPRLSMTTTLSEVISRPISSLKERVASANESRSVLPSAFSGIEKCAER